MGPSLLELLAELPDPRDPRGIRYPLVSVLALCLVAALAGYTSLTAVSQFGRLRKHRLAHALGFKRGTIPAASTISDLFRDLDAEHLDRLIGRWLASRHASGWEVINLDGKTACGSRDGEVPGTHLLAAYAPQASAVIAQLRVDAKTNEHKAALRLLGILPPLVGTVVTADAMFTHADVCAAVLEHQGEYVLYAKKNQPQLRDDLEATFAAAESGAFSPLPAGAMGSGRSDGEDGREGTRANRGADDHHHDVAQRVPGLAAGGSGVPIGTQASCEGEDDDRGGVWGHQSGPDGGGCRVVIGPDPPALVDRERSALRA
jgi:DDE_Tnp_1-associated/Transposase DDE domain